MDAAVRAMLTLAARGGWPAVTLSAIASETGISIAELRQKISNRADLLAAYGRSLDIRALKNTGVASSNVRDRLFDLLMDRFETLNLDRAGVKSIIRGIASEPKFVLFSLPHLACSMGWMLDAAGVATSGPAGTMRVAGLCALYLHVLRQWAKDESEDLSATMAALDQALTRVEGWAERLPG